MSAAREDRPGLADAIGRYATARPDAPAFRFMAREGRSSA